MDHNSLTLEEIRTAIDEADTILLKALASRFRAVRVLKKIKEHTGIPVQDPEREEQLKQLWKKQAQDLDIPESLALLMLDFILAESRQTQAL